MSLDERLRTGLEGLDALEGAPPDSIVDAVLGRGRRHRWNRRFATIAVVVLAVLIAFVVAPKALDALRSAGERRPAVPGDRPGIISTVAGTGAAWSSGDGGPAAEADLEYPVDLGFDGQGNLYILELGEPSNPPRVRKVDASGLISTVAGPGASGEAGDLILGTTFGAQGLAVDASGNVFIGGGDGPDIVNRVIRVDPSGAVTTVAGTGKAGFSGDGGPATDAEVQDIRDVAVDRDGILYISGDDRIRKVDQFGTITSIAGTGRRGFSGDGGPAIDAELDDTGGIALDPSGDVYFADKGNGRIRMIDTGGTITTVAGDLATVGPDRRTARCFAGDGGPAIEAHLCRPERIWVDSEGNLFIADTLNARVRVVDTNGIITTVAGNGDQGPPQDGVQATESQLANTGGVAIGPDGNLYIADSAHDRVRMVAL